MDVRRATAGWIGRLESVAAAQQGRASLWLPVLMGAGAVGYFALRVEPLWWIGAAVTGVAVLAAVSLRTWRGPHGVLLAVAATAMGFAAAQFAAAGAPPIDALPSHATIITGVVRGVEPVPRGRRITLAAVRLDGGTQPLHRRLRIRLQDKDHTPVTSGDRVRVRALVRPASPPAYPGAWDMQRDAYFTDLGGFGHALGPVAVDGREPDTPVLWIQRLQETINGRIEAVLPGSSGPLSQALLTGAMAGILEPDIVAFRDSGLAHLLSVSGVHIAIVMGLAMGAVRVALAAWPHAALFWPVKRIAAVAGLASGAFYMVLTGVQVPMVRSFVMAGLVTVAVLAGRRALTMRSLALAAALLTLTEPAAIIGASMQMSFFAVMALLAGHEVLGPRLRACHRDGGWLTRGGVYLLGLALTSLLAGGATTPFSAYHFGRVQVWFILSNMIAVPLTGVWVMPAGMLGLALMPFGLERYALVPMGWGMDAVLWVAQVTAALPGAALLVPHLPGWGLLVLASGLLWLSLWRGRLRLAGLLAVGLGLASPAMVRPPDVLVSSDARLIAVRTPSGVFIQQVSGGGRFTRDAWLRYWGAGPAAAIPRTGAAADGAIECAGDACLLRPRAGFRAVLLARGTTHRGDCRDISVIVSAEPARGLCARPWPKLVDRFTVWRDGAAAIWLGRGRADILTDRAERGTRPWVPPPPEPRRHAPPNLPVAPSESQR